jgi:hypothetical protein
MGDYFSAKQFYMLALQFFYKYCKKSNINEDKTIYNRLLYKNKKAEDFTKTNTITYNYQGYNYFSKIVITDKLTDEKKTSLNSGITTDCTNDKTLEANVKIQNDTYNRYFFKIIIG